MTGFSVVRGIKRALFSTPSNKKTSRKSTNQQQQNRQEGKSNKQNKVFTSEIGEYVDYEEIIDKDKTD
ncbi:hypothetical protein AwDysgo_00330 [Bacteroidales bacterium]|nr:hypothetical protein AwDysgo_00330 [Bacteroidales bacterium]